MREHAGFLSYNQPIPLVGVIDRMNCWIFGVVAACLLAGYLEYRVPLSGLLPAWGQISLILWLERASRVEVDMLDRCASSQRSIAGATGERAMPVICAKDRVV